MDEVLKCEVNKITHSIGSDKDSQTFTDKIELIFIPGEYKNSGISLEFYNSNSSLLFSEYSNSSIPCLAVTSAVKEIDADSNGHPYDEPDPGIFRKHKHHGNCCKDAQNRDNRK